MTQPEERQTILVSVSLTRELSDAVSEEVRAGRYASASDLVREALQRFLAKAEPARPDAASSTGTRLSTAGELMLAGRTLRAGKLAQTQPDLSEEEIQARIAALDSDLEIGPGLRRSPERLRKLTLHESD